MPVCLSVCQVDAQGEARNVRLALLPLTYISSTTSCSLLLPILRIVWLTQTSHLALLLQLSCAGHVVRQQLYMQQSRISHYVPAI